MKKTSVLLSALILMIFAVFLASQNKNNQNIDTKKESSVSVSTTEQKEISISDKPINVDEIKEENVFFFFNSTATFDPGQLCYTIDEMNESDLVDSIVKGIITDIDYVYLEGHVAQTILTVNVLESYKGNTSKEIKVYEDGGYVRLKDMLGEFKDKGMDLEKKLTKEQIENGLVEKKFSNAPHPKKGQQVILYLTKNPNKPPLMLAGSYMLLGSVYGKFTLDKNTGQYERSPYGNSVNFEKSISEHEIEKKLKKKFK
jgi:hypothetical protein